MLFFQAKTSEGPDFHKGKPCLCIYFNACLTFLVHPQVHVCSSTHTKIRPWFCSLEAPLWFADSPLSAWTNYSTSHNGHLTTNSRYLLSTQLFTVTSAHGQVKQKFELSCVEIHVAQSALVTAGKWTTFHQPRQVCRNSSHPLSSSPHGIGGAGCKEYCIPARLYFHRIKTV